MQASISFGDYLHHLVRSRGMSMQEFAEQCSCSPSTISRIRTGRRMPKRLPLKQWAELLKLSSEEKNSLEELALLAHAPEALRKRLTEAEDHVHEEQQRRIDVEQHYAEYRKTQNYYDGYWLSYNYSLIGDGRILRSMAHVKNDIVHWINKEAGQVQYSYRGKLDLLGDKVFIRMEEERGYAEYVQICMHSLFDFREPGFLYGILSGISGKNIRYPISNPAASKMIMVYIGSEDDFRNDPQMLEHIEGQLGNFLPTQINNYYPQALGDESYLRECLKLKAREDLNAIIARMLDNRVSDIDGALSADF
ncbi:MAG: helix-turn-helix transcriptional regulator [Planctomycetes bacterium]|nr:helix-turn-helix transcriptional regulator [Planctomycetota bacterium]